MLFVHGYCLAMGSWHYQRLGLADMTQPRLRMVFYDCRSHGRSGRAPAETATIDQLGDDLYRVLADLAPTGPVVLVGHSMGGMAIMALADRHPELFAARVVGVALLSTSTGQLAEVTLGLPAITAKLRAPVLPLVLRVMRSRAGLIERSRRIGSDIAWLLTRRYSFGSTDVSPALVEYVGADDRRDPGRGRRGLLPGPERARQAVRAGRLRDLETLIAVGDKDMLTPVEHCRRMAEAAARRGASGAGRRRAPGDDGAAGARQPAAAGVPASGGPGRVRRRGQPAGRGEHVPPGGSAVPGRPRRGAGRSRRPGGRGAVLAELVAASRGCTACPELAATRTTVVVGDAPAGARLALVGEAPGAEEDRAGRPFVGQGRPAAGPAAGRGRAGSVHGRGGERAAVPAAGQPHPDHDRGDPVPGLAGSQARPDRARARARAGAVRGGRVPRPRDALGAVRGTVHEIAGRRVLPTYHPSAAIRYGPNGEPLAGLRADLATAAGLLASNSHTTQH